MLYRGIRLFYTRIFLLFIVKFVCEANNSFPGKTQRSQMVAADPILLSIEEKLRDLTEKQKSISNSNYLEIISQRLQNVEEHIARAESFNKMRLQQIMENSMKSEFLLDQINRRIEKNSKQIENRFAEIDDNLEKIYKIQQNLEKEMKKINVVQSGLVTSVEDLNEKIIKSQEETMDTLQFINSTRQQIENHLIEQLQNIVQKDKDNLNTSSNNILRYSQNDITQTNYISKDQLINDVEKLLKPEFEKIAINVDQTRNDLKQRSNSVKTSTDECISIGNKIYTKIGTEPNDISGFLDNMVEELLQEIKPQIASNLDQLEMKMKHNFDQILNEQHAYSNNCRRLQLNEEQIEDKIVLILQNLFNYLDNKTERMQNELKTFLTYEQNSDINEDQLINGLVKSIKDKNSLMDHFETYSVSKISQIETNFTRLNSDIVLLQRGILVIDEKLDELKEFLNPRIKSSPIMVTNNLPLNRRFQKSQNLKNATQVRQNQTDTIENSESLEDSFELRRENKTYVWGSGDDY